MKRIMIALAALTLAFTANAQQGGFDNYAGLNLGAGLNTMTFNPNRGDQSLGLGFDAGIHYAHFFNEHFGFGFGVHYTAANAYAKYNFIETTQGLTHNDNPGVTYTLKTTFHNWEEREHVGLLGIPVELFYRSILNEKWTFIAGLGLQFDVPLSGSYSRVGGYLRTSGTFPSLGNHEVTDMPEHGFTTYDEINDAKIDSMKLSVSAIADLGFRMALGNKWGLYFGVYGGFGLNNMLKHAQSTKPLVEIDQNNASDIQYNGTFNSNEIITTGRVRYGVHLIRVGVKVGIDLGWDSKSTIAAREAAARAAAEQAEAERLAAEQAAREAAAKKAAEKAAAEKAAADRAAAEEAARKAAADRAAAEEAAKKAAAERAAAEEAAAKAAAQSAADRAAAEAAAAKAAAERAAAEKAAAERRALIERTRAEAEKQIKAINATVYFETAGTNAKFDATTDAAIHAICEAMKADESLTVTVYGHTDNTGSLQINMKYGQKRAEALKKYMVKLGAPAKNINCVSRGPNEPVADNDTEEGRAKNRRATVELK